MDETKKYYSQRAITIATYFGGPLGAGESQVSQKTKRRKTVSISLS
jgi:hypothetical protein